MSLLDTDDNGTPKYWFGYFVANIGGEDTPEPCSHNKPHVEVVAAVDPAPAKKFAALKPVERRRRPLARRGVHKRSIEDGRRAKSTLAFLRGEQKKSTSAK